MLTQLRSASGSWLAKLLLILLVLSFAVWGISGQIMGGSSGNVVTVGETRVSMMEYRLAYDRQISMLSQQFGTRITREQAQAFGLDQQVLAQLVAGAVLDEQAREMRLGLSRDRLATLTAEDPAFHGPDGRFNRAQFDYMLSQVGMRPEDYLRNREQVAIRQQIVEAVSDGLTVPDTFLRAVALYRGEDRTIEFARVPRSAVEPIEQPSDAELQAFFDENRSNYDAPEYRRVSYVKLEPTDIADPAAIGDDQLRAHYEDNRARYTTAERRTIDQIVFANEEAANAALAALADGQSYEEVVAAEGRTMDDVRLGTFERTRVADAAVAEAAFALDEGETSQIVAGSFGPIILRVTEIEPEQVRPFEDVADEIREEIALDEANRLIMDVYDGYEDGRAAGQTMQEAAGEQRLQVVTIEAVDRQGRAPDGTEFANLPERDALLAEAFDAEAGFENPPINIGSVGFLFYEVDEITPTRQRELDEVRERVATDWVDAQATERLTARAAEIEQSLRDGADFAELAESVGSTVETKRGLNRESDDGDIGASGVAAVFDVAQGGVGVIPAPEGQGRIVFRVSEVFEPAAASADAVPENARRTFTSGLADDLLDQLVGRLQSQYSVSIDRAAIAQAMSF